jgi:zinc/manganese transport system substrate-binding protein
MMYRRQALLALGASALGQALPLQAAPSGLRIVASFSILADIVQQVIGSQGTVQSLVGANADAHVYEPSPADAQAIRQADLVVVNGLHFEGWLPRLITSSGYRGPLVSVTDGITARPMGQGTDPHAWQDLRLGRHYAQRIEAALMSTSLGSRPEQAQAISRQSVRYQGQLQALHDQAVRAFAALPAGHKRVLTSHDAFSYFGMAYGLSFLAPQGWSTDTEASAAKVGQLIREIKAQQIRAIFIENMTDSRLVQRIARETGVRVGGTLYADALSAPSGPASTYLAMMRHNIDTLLSALR